MGECTLEYRTHNDMTCPSSSDSDWIPFLHLVLRITSGLDSQIGNSSPISLRYPRFSLTDTVARPPAVVLGGGGGRGEGGKGMNGHERCQHINPGPGQLGMNE